ncbi:SLC35A4 [Bugula neritina]|uniref:SLC35A4 n=1 Tax=Bugula neritina TaxID=10212 RepID=A0A7J7KRR9_BUGNE|nr:SLC35A4 [Bugula neritina]
MTFVAKAKWGFLFVVCMMYGCYGPLLLLSQVDGKLQYDPSQVAWLTELVKLIVSITLLSNQSILKRFSFREALPYFIPALCYFVNANICPRLMDHLDPATFSALSNIKVVITTLLYVIIMKRYPSSLQILALAILTAASAIHSYGLAVTGGKSDVSYHKGEPMEMRASVRVLLLFVACP